MSHSKWIHKGYADAEEYDNAAFARMAAIPKVEISSLSPRMQQIACDYEAKQEAAMIARETDLEYLRRTRPDMDDNTRVNYMLLSIVCGKSVKGETK